MRVSLNTMGLTGGRVGEDANLERSEMTKCYKASRWQGQRDS